MSWTSRSSSTQARMTIAQFRYLVCAGPEALEQSQCSQVGSGSWEKPARCTGVSGETQARRCSCSPSSPLTILHGVKPSTLGRRMRLDLTAEARTQVSPVCCRPMSDWHQTTHYRKHARKLRSALQNVKPRMTSAAWEEIQEMAEIVTTPRTEVIPGGYGLLGGDFLEPEEEETEVAQLHHNHTRPAPVSNAEHRGTQANPLLSATSLLTPRTILMIVRRM